MQSTKGQTSNTGSQRAYTALRQRILTLDLGPGEELDETKLADELGISRTPIREAIIRLAAEELVVVTKNRATKVPQLDFLEVAELFDALEVCQRVAVRWAAMRRTNAHIKGMREAIRDFGRGIKRKDIDMMRDANLRYHQIIGEASGNRYFKRLNDSLLLRSLRLAQLTLSEAITTDEAYHAHFEPVNRDHEEIVDYIEHKSIDNAEDRIRDHIRQFRVRALDYVSRNLADSIRLHAMKK
jgi:DNA-binding GntR family transcriptional regulator